MKLVILSLSLMVSAAAFGNNCDQKVLQDYIKNVQSNEFHSLSNEVIAVKKNEKSITAYGLEVALNYKHDVVVYFGSSEYMGGYGVEALVVDPATCETLKMENVYTE
jgi:hypothetical protein